MCKIFLILLIFYCGNESSFLKNVVLFCVIFTLRSWFSKKNLQKYFLYLYEYDMNIKLSQISKS